MRAPRVLLGRWFVLIAWTILGTVACAVFRPAPVSLPPETAAPLLASLEARAAYWQAYQAQATIRIQSRSGNYRLQGFLIAKPPDRLRFEATNPAGQTVWVLIFNPEGAMFWLPGEGVSYYARSGDTILNHFARAAIPAEVFTYCFVAAIPPDRLKDNQLQLVQEGEKILGRYADIDSHWRFTWELLSHPTALQSLSAVEEHAQAPSENPAEHHYTIRFDPPVAATPDSKPQKVIISAPQWQLEGTLKQLVRMDDVPARTFALINTPGAKAVNLDAH